MIIKKTLLPRSDIFNISVTLFLKYSVLFSLFAKLYAISFHANWNIPTISINIDENLIATANFAKKLGSNLQRIELLPYHKFGIQTYRQLGREYKLKEVEPPSDEHMERLKKLIESCGIKAQIGG